MTQWQTCKAHAMGLTHWADAKRGSPLILTIQAKRHPIGQRGNGFKQVAQLMACGVVSETGSELDRVTKEQQVALQLGFEGVVQHGGLRVEPGKRLWHLPSRSRVGMA